MSIIIYNSPNQLTVGSGIPVRVNLSIGIDKRNSMIKEVKKLQAILASKELPDIMMDLSLTAPTMELWEYIRSNFYGPIGVIPHYAIFSNSDGLNTNNLLNRIKKLFEGGVNFVTLHCTPNKELFSLAQKTRFSPTTSRGGGIIIRDMFLNHRANNIFFDVFSDICNLAKEFGAVINLGTTFRAASVAEGFDEVARQELIEQSKYCDIAKALGVQVVLEGPGHISLKDIGNYYEKIKNMDIPPMPLGPIVTDRYSDLDHVVAAVGASNLMMLCKGGIINAITSAEHKGGIPSFRHLLEGLRMAKLAAHISSLTYDSNAFNIERGIAAQRGNIESCIMNSKGRGCSRCGHICPLLSDCYKI